MHSKLTLGHEFVDCIPEALEERTVYVSIPFATAVHRCVCGCGSEVVTPLSPNGWQLTFDGDSITLYPSIGNWGFKCQSHYWIRRNDVVWAPKWSDARIAVERLRTCRPASLPSPGPTPRRGLLDRAAAWLLRTER